MNSMYLTDLIDAATLQRVQDAFSSLTGMAALTTDMTGKPVTEGSQFTDFCMKYTRNSPEGRRACEWCDKYGAEQTKKRGHQATYYCHAGLIDFAAPITVHGKQVGCFIGGQVLTEKPDSARIKDVASRIGVDPDLLLEAADKVHVLPKSTIDRAAQFLYEIAAILSDMAYSRVMTERAREEMESASRMKSDFLANMSHEIRTPMNAVIGMAEMALREDLSTEARYYINQIKSSGRELLTIINDILDFSKIESGKMDILPVEHEPMSVVNDIVNVVMTRLQDKDVELIIKLCPDIPRLILGDNIRVKQILINIANNAAKFTRSGKITIQVGHRRISDEDVEMQVTVEDTGIGIKEEDLAKIFQSFSQVDSKRNRNIEGTGLGLAITKQLLQLMGGDIRVESEYGKGSRFSFAIPQKIVDDTPSIELPEPETKAVAGLIDNPYVKEQLAEDCAALNVSYADTDSEEEFVKYMEENKGKEIFLLIENTLFTEAWEEFAKNNPDIKIALLVDFFESKKYEVANLLVMKKPVYALNLASLLKGGDANYIFSESKGDDFEFIAPDAEVLVVDDNTVNLTIAEGLLKPLKMKIQTAVSGREALEKAKRQHFDIIFMDHMMPEMDGIEATHLIRELDGYADSPIIALSANAIGGIKEKFLSEGMSDFVPKPIELHTLTSKIKQWLPQEMIQRADKDDADEEQDLFPETLGDLDIATAVGLLGSRQLFFTILENYYKAIEKKAAVIRESWEQEDWERYTIEVHALKSLSRQIGAQELADMAAELETAGNARDTAYIAQHTEALLTKYLDYIPLLEPHFKKEESTGPKREITSEELHGFFDQMREAAENLDMDQMEELIGEMSACAYSDGEQELFERLRQAVEDMDTEECEAVLEEWEIERM